MAVIQNPPVKQAGLMQRTSQPKTARDVPTRDVLLNRYRRLRLDNERRNSTMRHLLRLYESDPVAHGMRGDADQMEIIVNHIFDTVNTFVDFKGIPPGIHFYPPDLTEEGKLYADRNEKYLYALWDFNDMDLLWPRVMFDQGLYGWAAGGVLPTRDLDGFVKYRRFSPFNFLPQCYEDGNRVLYYFYDKRWPKERVLERWPDVDFDKVGQSEMWKATWPEGTLKSDETVVIEYCGEQWLIYMVADKVIQTINHRFGFCPARIFENIIKPDNIGGVSDVATYEMLQVYESELMSLVADIIAYWADPMLFISSDSLDHDKVNLGGVTIGRKGDDAKFLVPNVNLEYVESQMKRVRQVFHDGTIPETLYGRVETKGALGSAPVWTGLQTKFMVKLAGLYRRNGRNLAALNSMALQIAKKLYANKRIQWNGYRKSKTFELDIYGRDLGAYTRHRVFWDMSVTDPDRHTVMQLQLAGNRLQSKYRTMENLHLSPGDEFELMRQEDIYEIRKDAAKAMEVQRLQARFAEPTVESINRDVKAGVKGGQVYPRAGGEQRALPGRPPEPGAAPALPMGGEGFGPRRVIADLTAIRKLRGEVYLVAIDDTVDIAVTDKQDKGTIMNAPTMQAYRGNIVFITIAPGQVQEGWVKVR